MLSVVLMSLYLNILCTTFAEPPILNRMVAAEALNCAKGVIKWFGITDDYIIPTSGFAKAKPVERRDMIPYLSNECYYL